MRCFLILCLLGFTAPCLAAPPQLTTVIPRGWKTGANEVTVQGANFTDASRLLLDIPGATATQKAEPKPTATQMQFVVTLPPESPAGLFEVAMAGDEGRSAPLLIVVDPFSTVTEVEPNNAAAQAQLLTLPVAVEGRLAGSDLDMFAFDGRQGQRVVVEVAGRRLGANIKPVLRLLNATFLELEMALSSRRLGGDSRLTAVLPADGRYYLELHDLVYRGDNNQYRVLVGDLQVADHLEPLGGRRGSTLSVRFLGGTLPDAPPLTATIAPPALGDLAGLALPPGPLASPLPLPVAIGDLAELTEQPPADGMPQLLPVPGIVNGRLTQPDEHDKYRITVTPGDKLHIFVQSERLGTPLDGVLELRNDKDAVIATQDDGPETADPDFLYTVPADVTTLVLGVTDLQGRGGPAFAYRLGIEPAPGGDFELTLLNPLVTVPAGGSASIRVRAVRRDYAGPIRLKAVGDVPAGLTLTGQEIGAGVSDTLLSFAAPADSPLKAGTFAIVGEAGPVEQPLLVRTARLAKLPFHEGLPWLQTRVPGAVAKPGLLALDVEVTEPALIRGLEYTARVKVRRTPEQTGPVNLTVQTSQNPQAGGVQVAPVANLSIAENAAEGVIKITVPPTAPEIPLSFVVTGQLLNAMDKKTLVATAEAPSVSTSIVFPFTLHATPPAELARGARTLVPVKLTRVGKFNEPVQVAVTGLPGTIRTAPVIVPAGTTDFQIPLLIPPAQAGGMLANLKLTGTWAATPPLASTPQDLPLVVAAADPGPLLEIFEDGADFVAALTEGAGMAALEEKDIYSGKESVLVKPDQKARASLPGLGVAIAEAPMPGQYRFLRFAWKKKGGAGVLLELANGGRFGVAGPKGTDYRYVAGPDVRNTKAVRVADAAPAEWTVVTRDLFADHGPLTLTGLSLTPMDGEFALFDHIYLARTEADFPPVAK